MLTWTVAPGPGNRYEQRLGPGQTASGSPVPAYGKRLRRLGQTFQQHAAHLALENTRRIESLGMR